MSTISLDPLPTLAEAAAPIYKLTFENDSDTENPNEYDGGWRYISFNSNHVDSQDLWDYFDYVPGGRALRGKDIGIRRKLNCGTMFIVSVYEHSGSAYSLYGEGMNDQWDTTSFAGILVWEGKVKDLPKDFKKREESARSYLAVYADWANGNCYYYCLEDADENHIDSCGGFIGEDHFLDEVRELLKSNNITRVHVDGEAKWIADYHDLGDADRKVETIDEDDFEEYKEQLEAEREAKIDRYSLRFDFDAAAGE